MKSDYTLSYDYLIGILGLETKTSFTDLTKSDIYNTILLSMVNTTVRMLKFDGLPDTIPERDLMLKLQYYGYIYILEAEYQGKKSLWSMIGGQGGKRDPNYEPVTALIQNPWLPDINGKEFTIGKDCILIRHDSAQCGLMPINRLYASLMAESFITLQKALINSRTEYIPTAPDSNTAKAWEYIFKALKDGTDLKAVTDSNVIKNVSTLPFDSRSMDTIMRSIESIQYLKASWFNAVGLQSNFNMKREALNSAETGMNEQSLGPSVQDILENVQTGINKVNQLYKTSITVNYGPMWQYQRNAEYVNPSDQKSGLRTVVPSLESEKENV